MFKALLAIVLYCFSLVTFVICAWVYIPLLLIFGPDKSTWFRRIYARLMILSCWNKLLIINPPPKNKGPYLFMANHQSLLDGFILAAVLPYNFSAVAKKELFSIPLFGFIIRRLGLIPIDRKNHRDAVSQIDKAGEKIKSGTPVVIFPEGTRSKTGQVGSFKRGAFKLAFDSQAVIVPFGISGSYESQPSGSWLLYPGAVTVNFGQPILYSHYQELSPSQLSDLVREQIIKLSSNP